MFASAQNTLHFRRDAIKCAHCSSPSSVINEPEGPHCRHIVSGDAELTFTGSVTSILDDLLITLGQIQCPICRVNPYHSVYIACKFCSFFYHPAIQVRVTPHKLKSKTVIEEMFCEELRDYEPSLLDSS